MVLPFTLCSTYPAITLLALRARLTKTTCGVRGGTRAGCARGLYHPKEVQYDEYDGDNDQSMNPTACFREAWTNVPAEKAEQPQDYQNHDDSPQHEISPFD
jgi:hypothetical protein